MIRKCFYFCWVKEWKHKIYNAVYLHKFQCLVCSCKVWFAGLVTFGFLYKRSGNRFESSGWNSPVDRWWVFSICAGISTTETLLDSTQHQHRISAVHSTPDSGQITQFLEFLLLYWKCWGVWLYFLDLFLWAHCTLGALLCIIITPGTVSLEILVSELHFMFQGLPFPKCF